MFIKLFLHISLFVILFFNNFYIILIHFDTCIFSGCKIPDTVVFPQYNKLNSDYNDIELNTKNGIYKENCGINNLLFSYGHDEYMYQMLKANNCSIPMEGFNMVRFHSAYTWHTHLEYKQFMVEKDYDMMKWVLQFNNYDLYTKDDNSGISLNKNEIDTLWIYYQRIIDKYFDGENRKLKW